MCLSGNHLPDLIAYAWGFITCGLVLLAWRFHRLRNPKFSSNSSLAASNIADKNLTTGSTMPEAQTIQKMLMRELHDGMGGIATNMAFSATLGRNEADLQKKDEWLDKLQVLAAEASVEVRELMNALECTSMEWTDVIDALRRISSKVLGEQDITARVHVEGSWPTEEPGLLAGMSLIRMARECISNVVQHACADQVDITAYFSKDLFKLSISDNGCGFDLNTVRRGRGFNRLGKRVPELQGSWHIDSADGTRIIIDIPLPLQAATGNTTKESIK